MWLIGPGLTETDENEVYAELITKPRAQPTITRSLKTILNKAEHRSDHGLSTLQHQNVTTTSNSHNCMVPKLRARYQIYTVPKLCGAKTVHLGNCMAWCIVETPNRSCFPSILPGRDVKSLYYQANKLVYIKFLSLFFSPLQ